MLATDVDIRLLEPLASDLVEVMRHDLLADPPPDRMFDLAHARLLLMHVPARLEALRRMANVVRRGSPGGPRP